MRADQVDCPFCHVNSAAHSLTFAEHSLTRDYKLFFPSMTRMNPPLLEVASTCPASMLEISSSTAKDLCSSVVNEVSVTVKSKACWSSAKTTGPSQMLCAARQFLGSSPCNSSIRWLHATSDSLQPLLFLSTRKSQWFITVACFSGEVSEWETGVWSAEFCILYCRPALVLRVSFLPSWLRNPFDSVHIPPRWVLRFWRSFADYCANRSTSTAPPTDASFSTTCQTTASPCLPMSGATVGPRGTASPAGATIRLLFRANVVNILCGFERPNFWVR